jgi:hypothetical protein
MDERHSPEDQDQPGSDRDWKLGHRDIRRSRLATVPATLRLSNVLRINLNAGWEWDRVAGQHYATYGAGVDWRTPDNVWTLTAEVFGQLGARQDAVGVTEPRFQVGLRWRPIDDFNVDLIYGRNIYGENANWITLATVVRFHVGK